MGGHGVGEPGPEPRDRHRHDEQANNLQSGHHDHEVAGVRIGPQEVGGGEEEVAASDEDGRQGEAAALHLGRVAVGHPAADQYARDPAEEDEGGEEGLAGALRHVQVALVVLGEPGRQRSDREEEGGHSG